MKLNVVLAGEDSAGIQALRLLSETEHHLTGVLASPDRTSPSGTSVWQLAERLNCLRWSAGFVRDAGFAEVLRQKNVDLLLNVHSLFIITKEILTAPRLGCFNLHPGPLPRYAGLNSVNWAIFHGETSHGVTLHKMLPGIDTGPIAGQKLFLLQERETGLSLTTRCVKEGLKLVEQLLQVVATDPAAIPLVPQDLSQRTYFGAATPNEGKIDWSWPAQRIFNFVRAADYYPFHSPWRLPHTWLGNQEIDITSAALTGRVCKAIPGLIGNFSGHDVNVACGDEWLLIKRVHVNGRFFSAGKILPAGERLVCPVST